MNRTIFFVLIVVIVLFTHLSITVRSNADGVWRHWTIEDGLVNNLCTVVNYIDEKSVFINFDQSVDSAIFDGYSFQLLPRPNHAVAIHSNSYENLWSIYRNRIELEVGLLHFTNDEWLQHEIYRLHFYRGPTRLYIPFISYHPGTVFFIAENTLRELNSNTNQTVTLFNGDETEFGWMSELNADQRGNIWVLGNESIGKFNVEQHQFGQPIDIEFYPYEEEWEIQNYVEFSTDRFNNPVLVLESSQYPSNVVVQLKDNKWNILYYDADEYIRDAWIENGYVLWIVSDFGAMKKIELNRKQQKETVNHFESRNLYISHQDHSSFWLGSYDGLYHYGSSMCYVPDDFIEIPKLSYDIEINNQDNLIFTSGEYLYIYADDKIDRFQFPDVSPSYLRSYTVNAINASNIFINFKIAKESYIFDLNSRSFTKFEHPRDRFIEKVDYRDHQSIWMWSRFLGVDDEERYYLEIFDGEQVINVADFPHKLNANSIQSITLASDGILWIPMSGDGLYWYSNNQFEKVDIGIAIEDELIRFSNMIEIQPGLFWIGIGNCLYEYNGISWECIKDGMEVIRHLYVDSKNRIWMATYSGVYLYQNDTWCVYDKDYGLSSNLVNKIMEDSEGNIWISTLKGIQLFDPNADIDPPETKQAEIHTKFLVDEPIAIPVKGIDRWKQTKNEDLLYSYQLNNGEWSEMIHGPEIVLNKLPPGDYNISIRAIDLSFNTDSTPVSYSFQVVNTPIQQQPWFLPAIIIIFLTILALSIYSFYTRFRLKNYAINLEAMVEERTEELTKTHEQLLQSQKMESIGVLAGGIAHDFNNILTGIIGYSDIIIEEHQTKPSPHIEFVKEIHKAGRRAASLVQQILMFSRKQVIQPEVLNINELIESMEKMLTRIIGEYIEFQTVLNPQLDNVLSDRSQLEQILLNLIVNAKEAIEDNGNITVETATVDLDAQYCQSFEGLEPGRFVMIAVSDNGAGISKEIQNKIFEPFFTTKKLDKGTGLGLSTVYGIIKHIGGHISIYSELEHGTTFKVYLPAVNQQAVTNRSQKNQQLDLTGTESVLLVEDEDIVRNFTALSLQEKGYSVITAVSPKIALEIVKGGFKADLLITDVILPKMNGKELAEQIIVHIPEIEVLFISGYTDQSIEKHGILDEGINFLQKPFNNESLLRKVKQVLHG